MSLAPAILQARRHKQLIAYHFIEVNYGHLIWIIKRLLIKIFLANDNLLIGVVWSDGNIISVGHSLYPQSSVSHLIVTGARRLLLQITLVP